VSLPRSLDDLRGLRAARWIRESTSGQFDAFGPDAQREQQDRAVERWGLVDTGLAWQVAHSGRTIGSTAAFAEMMAAAGVEYDVLVVGYVSRFARDVRTAVNARHDLHAAGAAILFADERILTSDDDAWDSWAREAVEAESYSRKLARRIREGYAAKRRRLGEPGGRPPHGFVRTGRPPRLEPSDALVQVREIFAAAAAGRPDRQVAGDVGLPLDTVRGILTNPIYAGRLRDGSAAAVEPVVDEATWQRVQQLRARRRTRAGRPATNRVYALPMLRCGACGRRLIGDSGRYRHLEPCAEFTAARRRRAWKNQLVKAKGSSYPAAFYEDLVPHALQAMALSASQLVAGAAWYVDQRPEPDVLGLRRVATERDRALARYARDRDVATLERAMAQLDAEERALQEHEDSSSLPEWPELVAKLRDLASLWSHPGVSAESRKALAEAAFESVDAIGARRLAFTMSPPAGGVQAVVMVGARGFDPTVTIHWPPALVADVERTFGRGG
jgi:DNA invertase Pin-like site-specific DNA recombinase